jgi:glyoxylase-like metal-dependent hydrolase (beta-lactamase superfamily II)
MRKILLGALVLVALAACHRGAEATVKFAGGETKVTLMPLAGSNVYFIQTERGYLMVDTGMAARGKAVEAIFSRAGIEPAEVSLIVITHVHGDHVGGLAFAKELTGAQVLCHRIAADFIKQGRIEAVVGGTRMGSIIAAISPKKFKGVAPDILVDDEFDLNEYGLAGKIIHTPGHSSASITIILDNGETLVGDQVRGEHGKLSLGMFYEDEALLIKNLEKVAEYDSRIIYLSHGTFTDNQTLVAFIQEHKRSSAVSEKS